MAWLLNKDAWLHALGAAIMTLVFWPVMEAYGAFLVAGFWLGREWGQEEEDNGFLAGGFWNWGQNRWPEAIFPVVASLVTAMVL